MTLAYEVTKRGDKGQPLEIACTIHPGCDWRLATTGPRKDDDPILQAMMAAHMSERATPDRKAGGHERQRRR